MTDRPGVRCAIWGLRGPRGSSLGDMARGQSGEAAEKHSARPAKRGRRAAQILRGGGAAEPQSLAQGRRAAEKSTCNRATTELEFPQGISALLTRKDRPCEASSIRAQAYMTARPLS
jgi:hypothetical protein